MKRTLCLSVAALVFASPGPAPTAAQQAAPATWDATLAESDGTELAIDMTLAMHGADRWEFYSRAGAAYAMVPWYQRLAGRLLGKFPPRGSLVHLANGTRVTNGDKVVLRGTLESPMLGTRVLVGTIQGNRLHAELRRGSDTGFVAGVLDAVPAESRAAHRDYPAIATETVRIMRTLVYDPRFPERPGFARFVRDFSAAARRAHDDLDLVMAFQSLKAELGSSHFNFIRNPKIARTPLDSLIAGDPAVDPARFVRVQFPAPGLAYLYVSKWDRVGPIIDRAFARIDSAAATVLIIDIRGNPGGDATSLAPAAHLVRDTTPIGVFVGRPWYAAHAAAPTRAEQAAFPVMASENEALQLLTLVRDRGSVVARVPPRAPYFGGEVYLLMDRRSASASEPLAHFLKTTHRATLIGERTAGMMLTALPHPVGDEFIVTVPEADYFAADGTRLEGNGVEPDIAASSAESLIRVGEQVRRTLPYSGTLWLGMSYTTLRRYDEAERALRDALALAPDDAGRRIVQARLDALRALPKR